MRKRSRLNAKERTALRDMADDVIDLRYNQARRLRNAILALALYDPRWMTWVEQELPDNLAECFRLQTMLLIEARARAIALKPYQFFHREQIGWLIFRHDWAFTDRGTLSPG